VSGSELAHHTDPGIDRGGPQRGDRTTLHDAEDCGP
jgi:hypothetical protein